MSSGPLTIRRARLRNTDVDATTARLRLEPQLGTAELRPRGLAPSAVLCVRRVADPLPGRIELDSTQARPPPEWERAFVDALTRLLERAARPAREAVPANAEAVLFADRSELLACLARDARDGVAWTRWWWRSLWPSAHPSGDPVVAEWLSAPEHVPGALALLAARGEAVSFVGALPLAAAAELARRVAAAYGATELERALAPLTSPTTAARVRRAVAAPHTRRGVRPPAEDAPWCATVPEAVVQPLASARSALLGVALALRRTPAAAGSGAFATAVSAWLENAQDAKAAPPAAPRTAVAERPDREEPAPRAPRSQAPEERASSGRSALAANEPERTEPPLRDQAAVDPETQTPAEPAPHALSDGTPSAPTRPAGDHLAGRRAPHAAAVPDGAAAGPRASPPAAAPAAPRTETGSAQAPGPPRARRSPKPGRADAVEPEPIDEPWEAPAFGIETEVGGAFYLLNLFLYLGLYGDFTQPLARGLTLDPWRCVALVARRLLGPGHRRDPLWEVLRRLARPSTFRPPRAWRTPRSWLDAFDDGGVWRWSAASGTLRLEHPDGFPVLALPRTREPAQVQLARELRRLHLAPQLRRASLRREPAQPLARWVARLSRYTEARLRAGLGLPVETLLLRHARVFVTASHVDVVLSLAELPLEVRFAGLDRTPGWIPATGRFVAFHFE